MYIYIYICMLDRNNYKRYMGQSQQNHEKHKYSQFDEDNEKMKVIIKNFEVNDENCFPPPQPIP